MVLDVGLIEEARDRIAGRVRHVGVADVEPGLLSSRATILALEQLQHSGSFKARGAYNFLAAHLATGAVPSAGITIASGGNAGLACAWAAHAQGVAATVFVPESAPLIKVERLRAYGADVRLVGNEYAEASAACEAFATESGAVRSHAYDHPLIAAGAGTLLREITSLAPRVTTVVVAVGGGGLFAGVATAAAAAGMRTVAVEPRQCRALNAALEAGQVVDVPVQSIAADSLGARRTSEMALAAARQHDVESVLVDDPDIAAARRLIWDELRLVIEYGAATAVAGLTTGAYGPGSDEVTAVVICGANTDPSDLLANP